jgi:hypothetical protein
MAMLAYPLIFTALLMLWLCVVSATRQAEIQKKTSEPQFPTVKHGYQINTYAGGLEPPPANSAPAGVYQGQPQYASSLGAPQYQQAFGSARTSTESYSDTVPISAGVPVTSNSMQLQNQNLEGFANPGIPQLVDANGNPQNPFRHRQFDLPGELAKPTTADETQGGMANYGASGGYPVYGGSPPPPPGANYQQPMAGQGQGNSDSGLNPHHLTPRVVVVSR